MNNSNYTGIGDREKIHKYKLKKETNNDNFSHMQNTWTPESHRYMKLYFKVTNKFGHKASEQGNVDSDKQNRFINNPHNNKWEKRNS